MALRAIRAKVGETEIVERRTLKSKVFQTATGFRVRSKIAPQHWDDNGTLVEVDDTPVSDDGGRTWRTTSTPYVLSWDTETLTLTYQSKRGGDVTVRLAALDGVPFDAKPSVAVQGQDIICTIAPQLDIRLRVRTHGVEIYKVLHGPAAPTTLSWEVVEGDLKNIKFKPTGARGLDNMNKAPREKGLNFQRAIELTHDKSAVDAQKNPGKQTYTVTETFTGKTQVIDEATMARSFVAEVEYPVEIDVSVHEDIATEVDDGLTVALGTWGSYGPDRSGNAYANITFSAWRFQSVDIPQGATINSATLTVNVTAVGGTCTLTMVGENVDDAPVWNHSDIVSPALMAATTATATSGTAAGTGAEVIDIKTIVQEIVNRAGWTNNNDMRFGFSAVASGTGYVTIEDLNAAGTADADLDIDYTAGGATNRIRFPSTMSGMGVGGMLGGNRIE